MMRFFNFILLFTFCIILLSCKLREFNYITYYNKVNEVDSILRFQKDTLTTIKKYKKLFRKYGYHNQPSMREFETYIALCYKHKKDFGGKKSLYKLINLIAPYKDWYEDQNFYSFLKSYGIDSLQVVNRIKKQEEKYNKVLADSFAIAYKRDQESRQNGYTNETEKADKNNIALFRWTLKNYGFPSAKKIGRPTIKLSGDIYPILLMHFPCYEEDYQFLKTELLKYVESGECNPQHYAVMVDRNLSMCKGSKTIYYAYPGIKDVDLDTIQLNKNRKSIGLPSIKHKSLFPSYRPQILRIK